MARLHPKNKLPSLLETGFTIPANAQERVWQRLNLREKVPFSKRLGWLAAFACAVLLAIVYSWPEFDRPQHDMMRYKPHTAQLYSQAVGEAGPCGLEQSGHYIPFQ